MNPYFERNRRMSSRHTVSERKEIFLALVTLQDGKMNVADSKQRIIDDYGLTAKQLEQIIEEGTDKEWPPFDGTLAKVG
jgi:hypothetical protein